MGKTLTIPTIFSAVDKFSGPVNKMAKNTNSAFSKMDRQMRKIEKRAFKTSRQAAGVGIAIAAPLGLMANEAVKFEEKMSNVATLVDTTNESMEKMGEEVLTLSKKLPVPIEELTESLYDVRSAGIAAEDSMATLEASSKLAVGGLGTVQEATNITTSALNAFESEGLNAAQTTDILFKTVKAGKTTIGELSQAFGSTAPIIQSAGVKLDDFSAATAALTTLGTPAAQAQNQIRASITSLQKPSKDMEKVFKKLGVTTDKELIQKFGGLVGGYEAVIDASSELGLNQAKVFRSTEALAAVTSLTGATNEAYVDTLASMRDGTNELDKAFDKQSKTAKGTMQIAKNNFQGLAITLGNVLIPIISDLMAVVTPMIERFATWARNNKGTVRTILKVAAAIGGLAFAISGISGAIGFAAKAMRILNIVMNLNPVVLLTAGIVALGTALYVATDGFQFLSAAQKVNNEVSQRALDKTIDQRTEITILFKALRKAEVGTEAYASVLTKIEQISPGITAQYNLQAGALKDINAAEKELTASIMKRAEVEARAEILKEKTKERIRKEQEGPSGFMAFAQDFGLAGGPALQQMTHQQELRNLDVQTNVLAEQVAQDQLDAINTKKTEQGVLQETITESKENVTVDFINMPDWMYINKSAGANISTPGLSTTNGQ